MQPGSVNRLEILPESAFQMIIVSLGGWSSALRRTCRSMRQGHDEVCTRLTMIDSQGLEELPQLAHRLRQLHSLVLLPRWCMFCQTPVSLAPIATLYGTLRHLKLSGTAVTDTESLSQLTGLTHLDLSCTRFRSTHVLRPLQQLRCLELADNGDLTDLTPLTALTCLTSLDLSGTAVTDTQPLQQLSQSLLHLSLYGLQPEHGAERLFGHAAAGLFLTPLTALTGLKTLVLPRSVLRHPLARQLMARVDAPDMLGQEMMPALF